MSQQTITDGELGLNVRNALNGMFTELYGAIVVPLRVPGVASNTVQVIGADTFIQDIALIAASGTPTIRIGLTANGQELMPDTVIGSVPQFVSANYYCGSSTSIYITITGSGSVNIRFDILNNYF